MHTISNKRAKREKRARFRTFWSRFGVCTHGRLLLKSANAFTAKIYLTLVVLVMVSVALSGLVMYGFTHPSLVYLLEQLPGAHRCHLYEFKYHREHAVSAADDDDDVSPSLFATYLHFVSVCVII